MVVVLASSACTLAPRVRLITIPVPVLLLLWRLLLLLSRGLVMSALLLVLLAFVMVLRPPPLPLRLLIILVDLLMPGPILIVMAQLNVAVVVAPPLPSAVSPSRCHRWYKLLAQPPAARGLYRRLRVRARV